VIVTVTLSPSVDRTIEVDVPAPGWRIARHWRTRTCRRQGINVTRVLAAHGVRSRAVLPVGGGEGHNWSRCWSRRAWSSSPCRCGPRRGATSRSPNRTGRSPRSNAAGQPLSGAELDACCAAVLDHANPRPGHPAATWVVAGGKPALSASGHLLRRPDRPAAPSGVPVAVDTSGRHWRPRSRQAPPWSSQPRGTGRRRRRLAGHPRRRTGRGDRTPYGRCQDRAGQPRPDGAVLVSADGHWHGEAAAVTRSAVGAGDAMLAGSCTAAPPGRPLSPSRWRGAPRRRRSRQPPARSR